MNDCLFCQIADGKIPAKIHFEDKDVMVFEDIHPQAPIHLLLIPKRHIEAISAIRESDCQLMGKLILTAKRAARQSKLENGFRLVGNSGLDSGQIINHLHFHLLGGKKLGPIA